MGGSADDTRGTVSPSSKSSPSVPNFTSAGDVRRAVFVFGLWMAAIAGSLACGMREDNVHPARSNADGELPGIHTIALSEYPRQHRIRVSGGQGFVPLGLELGPGMPMRVEVSSVAGANPWGGDGGRAGVGAPEPLRADGAVLLRLGSHTLVAGTQTVLRSIERVRPEIAVNSNAWRQGLDFDIKIAWGEPQRSYDPQLRKLGLVPGQGGRTELLAPRDGAAGHLLQHLPPGARVWVVPPQSKTRGRPSGASWMGRSGDGQVRFLDRPMGWALEGGGELRLSALTRSSVSASPRIEVFDAIGTRAELIPMQVMDRVKIVDLSIEPRRFVKVGLSVQAGDLVRVEVRGENRLRTKSGMRAHNVGRMGGLREVSLPLRNGDRGWLVPGGRERGLYLRVGERVVELKGSDAFYAPEDGQIEIGVNQCFDGGDWTSYAQCRKRLADWELDLKVVVGISSARD